MTDLRTAAQQALEALCELEHDTFHPAKVFKHKPAIIALRAALAQQADPGLIAAAQAVLARWHSPAWAWDKQGPTADLMVNLQVQLKYEVKK
jgi:hypothetical protein